MRHLFEKIAAVVPTLEGWCTVEKAQWLAAWIVRHKCIQIVEIGVFGGRSLIPMGMAMMSLSEGGQIWPGRIVGLDPYDNLVAEAQETDEANRKWWETIDLQRVYRSANAAIVAQGLGEIVSILLETSEVGVLNHPDLTLDIVHVDGSHNESASTLDVKLWWPKLRVGGIMVMDDTNWHQVQKAKVLVAGLGEQVHESATWEVFQKTQ